MQHIDRIIRSKNVFTAQDGIDTARELAIAIAGDRIVAVGAPDDVIAAAPAATPVIDYGEQFVCPGFHDAHLHFFHTSVGSSPYHAHGYGHVRGGAGATRARVFPGPARRRLGCDSGLARLPLGPARASYQGVARCGIPRSPLRYVFGRRPYAVAQQPRTRGARRHARQRAASGRWLRQGRKRRAHGHCSRGGCHAAATALP